jgi:hypothetical protein
MNKVFIIILFSLCYWCTPINYQFYVDKGDEIIKELYSDSLNVQYASKDFCIYKETIEGESGDFINEHIQYYNGNKELVAYKRISIFFNSICYDGALKEETLYSISNRTLNMEKQAFYKEDGSLFEDTLDCEFNYRFEYKLHYRFSLPE